MHTLKALRNTLPMQWFVSHIAFRETVQDKIRSAVKRYNNVPYRFIAKCHKAIQNARVKQRTPGVADSIPGPPACRIRL